MKKLKTKTSFVTKQSINKTQIKILAFLSLKKDLKLLPPCFTLVRFRDIHFSK